MQDRPEDYERARGKYIIDSRTMQVLPKSSVVMHPLPRVDEVRFAMSQRPPQSLHVMVALKFANPELDPAKSFIVVRMDKARYLQHSSAPSVRHVLQKSCMPSHLRPAPHAPGFC